MAWKINGSLHLLTGPQSGAHISAIFPGLGPSSPLWEAIRDALGGTPTTRNFLWRQSTWRVSAWPDANGQSVRGVCAPLQHGPAEPRLVSEILSQQSRLARHMSHDLNGLVGGIINYVELAEQELTNGVSPRHELRRIRTTALEIADRVRDLRRLTVTASPNRVLLTAIHAWLTQEVALLRGHHARQTLSLDLVVPEPPPIPVLEEPLREALQALLQNADEANPPGGSITIRTRLLGPETPELQGWPQLAPGHHLALSVADTGIGMSAETLAHASEPFFSTERTRRGLGLSRVLGCAHQHGGAFFIESALGAGTTVTFTIPLQPPPGTRILPTTRRALLPTPPPPAEITLPPRASTRTPARILLADDTEDVRVATRRVLERSHHTVTEASDGHAALQLFQAAPDAFDIAVLDSEMPGEGLTIAEQLRALRPALPILIVTGHQLPQCNWPVIEKPYNPLLLLDSIQRLLPSSRPPSPPPPRP